MSKYKVNETFRGIAESKVFKSGDTVELTNKRAKEITDKLGKGFITEVKAKKEKAKTEKGD